MPAGETFVSDALRLLAGRKSQCVIVTSPMQCAGSPRDLPSDRLDAGRTLTLDERAPILANNGVLKNIILKV